MTAEELAPQLTSAAASIEMLQAAVIVLDGFTGKIPNVLVLAGLLNGCFCQMLRAGPTGLWQAVTAVLAIFVLSYSLYLLHGLGAGDIKLYCVIASYLGFFTAAKIVLASLFAGAILGIIHRIIRKEKRKFCFSPAILLSAVCIYEGIF